MSYDLRVSRRNDTRPASGGVPSWVVRSGRGRKVRGADAIVESRARGGQSIFLLSLLFSLLPISASHPSLWRRIKVAVRQDEEPRLKDRLKTEAEQAHDTRDATQSIQHHGASR